ncbi:MAG: PAS domain-containing sensor histidine kinase [Pseudomonadales bacterium]
MEADTNIAAKKSAAETTDPELDLSAILQNVSHSGRTAEQSGEKLQQAFSLFNGIADSLQKSYASLEQHTQALRLELTQLKREQQHERLETRKVERRLENLLQCLPGGVVLLDTHGYVEDCNPVAEDFLGSPLKSELWLDVIDRAFNPQLDDGHEISLRDGRRISLATRSLEPEPGQLILLTDLTETRQLQDKLHHNERLIEMGKMMAALAHQLRTPLASATLYAGHLCTPALEPSQSQKFANKVMEQLQAIEQQISDMLVFARSDLPVTEKLESTEFARLLTEAIAQPVKLHEARANVSCHGPVLQILCNREVLIGAVMNLVLNALQADQSPRLDIEIDSQSGHSLIISVKDEGPGFDTDREKVFFTNKPGGTGLGLAVVRAVAAAHQARFELRSAPGEGTVASIELPALAANTEHRRLQQINANGVHS